MQKEGGRKDKKFRSLEVRRKYIALKNFGSNTNTKIGPWFWFPIPKPGFGRTLQTVGEKKIHAHL